jgi:hypothetical protein
MSRVGGCVVVVAGGPRRRHAVSPFGPTTVSVPATLPCVAVVAGVPRRRHAVSPFGPTTRFLYSPRSHV